jgi:3-oxoacyl-[acyl-carrier protein] reductase
MERSEGSTAGAAGGDGPAGGREGSAGAAGGGLLAGKRVIVTGASRGIGRGVAEACAEAGADLVLNARDAEALAATAARVTELGARCETVVGSVADYEVCERIVGRSVEAFGGVDCLFNNAGIVRDRSLAKMSAEEFDDVIAVNLRGAWACGKLAAAAMREGGGGSIVNVVSATAFSGQVGQTNYGAAKGGVAAMTRTWTRELSRYGIRVNAIWPIAETDMTGGLIEAMLGAEGNEAVDAAELGFGKPAEIAPLVVYLASDAAAAVNGQILTFNGRKLALWSHPAEVVSVHRDGWSAAELARAFEAGPVARLQTLYDPF